MEHEKWNFLTKTNFCGENFKYLGDNFEYFKNNSISGEKFEYFETEYDSFDIAEYGNFRKNIFSKKKLVCIGKSQKKTNLPPRKTQSDLKNRIFSDFSRVSGGLPGSY